MSDPGQRPLATSDPPARARPRLRTSTEIQGNVLAAFNKDHMVFLLVELPEGDRARAWLAELEPLVATTDEVETFNERYSEARRKLGGKDPEHLHAVWTSLGLTVDGLRKLWPNPAEFRLPDARFRAFQEKPAARARLLDDTGDSDPARWLFGAHEQPAVDAIVTVAADRPPELEERLGRIREACRRHGVTTLFEQEGETLPGDHAGHEHFGFKDGISQPGVADFHEPEPGSQDREGHPGEVLIKPGEFVLGEPRERGEADVPEWMTNGSFQVFRRLAQDVPGWWAQVRKACERDLGMTEDELAAKLVGRWRAGTPLANSDASDDRSTEEPRSNNDFDYGDDADGLKTPRFAHIRKVYPRDNAKHHDRRRRIMRRGIPFGRLFDPNAGRGGRIDEERGLVFNAYCSDLEDQFEFLQQQWANNADFPARDDGRDPIIGANGEEVTLRLRSREPEKIRLSRFVRTTGAVYAFAPSKRTLKRLAAGDPL